MDHLHDDIDTLKICSLVSHSWLLPSQYHIYRELKFRVGRDRQGCKDPDLLGVFLLEHSQLSSHITVLSLTFVMRQSLDLFNLRQILHLLPGLRSLQLAWPTITFGDSEMPSLSSSQRFQLDSLSLVQFGPAHPPFVDVSAILALFYAVVSLSIEYPHEPSFVEDADPLPSWVSTASSLIPRISNLALITTHGETRPIFRLFHPCSDLRRLAVRLDGVDNIRALEGLVLKVCSRLTHLEVDVSLTRSDDEYNGCEYRSFTAMYIPTHSVLLDNLINKDQLRISSCSILQTLSLCFDYHGPQSYPTVQKAHKSLIEVLRNAPPTLHQIYLRLYGLRDFRRGNEFEGGLSDFYNWRQFERVLENLPNLRFVTFQLTFPRDEDWTADFEKIIKSNLPRLHARGFFQFTSTYVDCFEFKLLSVPFS